MKILLKILIILPIIGFAQGALIFSEYGEGTSFNKWIEIYNPTSQNIPLDDYRYNFCWNGCDDLQWEFSIPFDSGYVLMSGATYLLVHFDASSILLNASNQTTNLLGNGNDVAALYHTSSNTIIDIIGVFDSTEVTGGWDVDGILNATLDHTMLRGPDVCAGNLGDWTVSDGSSAASEWLVEDIDTYNNIGNHNSNCINTTFSTQFSKPFSGNIIKVIDFFGRETKQTNQPLFFIYDNGKVEKRIIVE